jgi:hypothetical protein
LRLGLLSLAKQAPLQSAKSMTAGLKRKETSKVAVAASQDSLSSSVLIFKILNTTSVLFI